MAADRYGGAEAELPAAWVVVGGAGCALGDSGLTSRAQAALADAAEARVALAEVCGDRMAP